MGWAKALRSLVYLPIWCGYFMVLRRSYVSSSNHRSYCLKSYINQRLPRPYKTELVGRKSSYPTKLPSYEAITLRPIQRRYPHPLPIRMSSSGDATTSSRGQLSSRSPTRIMGPVQQVRLAYQVGNRFFTLSSDIDATSGGDTVAREVYYRWKEEAAAGTLWYRLQSLLWKPVLQIGAVSTVSNTLQGEKQSMY